MEKNAAEQVSIITPRKYKWELLGILWVAFFLNQGDRQVFSSVMPLIRQDLGLSDLQLGLVATIFTLFYGLLVPVAGYLGDVFQKRWIVILSLLTFSAGTLMTGFGNGLFMLIFYRSIATGAGEAFYYPAANTLIAQYHDASRGVAMAIHQTANYTGVVISGLVSAWIGERFGWRVAFFSFGIFGILWAILAIFRFRDDKRDLQVVEDGNPGTFARNLDRVPILEVLGYLVKKPTILFIALAFGGMIFVHIGYLTWMPTYLHEKFSVRLSTVSVRS